MQIHIYTHHILHGNKTLEIFKTMTYKNIYEFFKGDETLLNYFDPTSHAASTEEAALEVYTKLVEHSKEKECEFYRTEVGYLFFSKGLLISFCVKPQYRNRKTLRYFSNIIKEKLGDHFSCFLFNRNTRAINFLEALGMKKEKSNELVTLLTI